MAMPLCDSSNIKEDTAMPTLTEKELKALEDELGTEQLLVKKYRSYAMLCCDQQLQTQCEQIATQHQNHFDRLMGFLY